MRRHQNARRAFGVAAAAIAAIGLIAVGVAPAGAQPSATPAPAPTPTTAPDLDPEGACRLDRGSLGREAVPGWSSYSMQVYSGNSQWITGAQIIAQSDAMHAKLQKAGYDSINIDAGWSDGVDANGRPVPSAKLYPQGFQKSSTTSTPTGRRSAST